RVQQREAHKNGGYSYERVGRVQLIDCLGVIDHGAISRGLLHEPAEDFGPDLEIGVTRHAHLDATHAGASLHDVDRLRLALCSNEEDFLPLTPAPFERVAHR